MNNTTLDIKLLMAEIGDWSQFHEDSSIERWFHETIHEEHFQTWKVIIRRNGRKSVSRWRLNE